MQHAFATTRWSVVIAARDDHDESTREALATLCETYWSPLYAFLRRRGCDAEEAADVTQAYFAQLLEKKTLGSVDPSRGRFRSFLLVSLRHFLSDQRDHQRAAKRGGTTRILSLDVEDAERDYRSLAVDDTTPEGLFEKRWAQTVVDRTLAQLEREHRESGSGRRFELLSPYLTGDGDSSYREVADQLGLREGAVKTAIHRMRLRFGRLLRDEVADTVGSPDEVEDEMRHLLGSLR